MTRVVILLSQLVLPPLMLVVLLLSAVAPSLLLLALVLLGPMWHSLRLLAWRRLAMLISALKAPLASKQVHRKCEAEPPISLLLQA